MSPDEEHDMDRILAAARRVAAPGAGDRERISSVLRARLAAGMVDGATRGTLAAASRAGAAGSSVAKAELGRNGWISIVMTTSLMTGALGFALGYDMRGGELPAALSPGSPPTTEAPARNSEAGPTPDAVVGPHARAHSPASATGTALPADGASPHARAPARVAVRSTSATSSRAKLKEGSDWPFAKVLERLHRANLALRRGQTSLVLIQLAELDRWAGEVLREEREVTRVLALCASGDTEAAKRAAAPLRAGAAQSIYAHRLDTSCVGEP